MMDLDLTVLLPDNCDNEGCMLNDKEAYPNLCSTCTQLWVNSIMELPLDKKIELFMMVQQFLKYIKEGNDDEFLTLLLDRLDEEGMSMEKFEERTSEVWNNMFKEEYDLC